MQTKLLACGQGCQGWVQQACGDCNQGAKIVQCVGPWPGQEQGVVVDGQQTL